MTRSRRDEDVEAREALLVVEARRRFESWCALDAPAVPDDPVDAIQVTALRWRNREFGLPDDFRVLAGVVEEMGELAESSDPEKAIDSVGDVCIFLGHLLASNRLAISAVVDAVVARMSEWHEMLPPSWDPAAALGALSHALLKHADGIRGLAADEPFREALLRAAIEIVHSAVMDAGPHLVEGAGGLAAVYRNVAGAVMMRRRASYPGSRPEKEIES